MDGQRDGLLLPLPQYIHLSTSINDDYPHHQTLQRKMCASIRSRCYIFHGKLSQVLHSISGHSHVKSWVHPTAKSPMKSQGPGLPSQRANSEGVTRETEYSLQLGYHASRLQT